MNRVVLYTINFGGYDPVLPSENYTHIKDLNCDVILFTDDKSIVSDDTRKVIHAPILYNDPRLTSKRYKMYPHLYLPLQYQESIFCDGRIVPNKTLMQKLLSIPSPQHLIVGFKHKRRQNLYHEFKTILRYKIFDWNERVERQLRRYRATKYPNNNGLLDSCCLYRKHLHPYVIRLGEYWFNEIMTGSTRDQLSFNFVIWYLKFDPKSVLMLDYQDLRPSKLSSPNHKLKQPSSFLQTQPKRGIKSAKYGDRDITQILNERIHDTNYQYLYISRSIPLYQTLKFPSTLDRRLIINGVNIPTIKVNSKLYLMGDYYSIPPLLKS